MQIYQDVKEQIRRSIDLVDLVSEHVALKRAGRNLRGLCPFHKEDTPSFNVLPERQIFKCFGCNAGGDIFKFVQLREGVGFAESIRILADRAGLRLETPSASTGRGQVARADLARINDWAAGFFYRELLGERGGAARAYLERRRISAAMIEQFQIGLALGDGRIAGAAAKAGFGAALLCAADLVRTGERGGTYETFRDRLMFPIRDATRRCLGFGGRTLVDAPAKYLNTSQTALFDKSRSLFGLDQARNAIGEQGCAVLVEGYTDCIACHQHGFKYVVATLGTAATDEHMTTIRRYVDSVVLFFDSDAAGVAAAERATAIAMQHNLRVRLARVPEGKDPAEFLESAGPGAFAEVLNSSNDALRFLWERTLARFQNPVGGQGPRQALSEFVRLVGELSRFRAVDAIQRGLILNQTARLLGLPLEEISGMFVAASPRAPARSAVASSRPSASMRTPVSSDLEQKILTEMLGVVLCRPELRLEVAGECRPERFTDPLNRAIAQRVFGAVAGDSAIDVAALVADLESTEEAERAADLVFRAEEKGSHEETLRELRSRLAVVECERGGREASRAIRECDANTDWNSAEMNARLAAIHQGFSQRHGPLAPSGAGAT